MLNQSHNHVRGYSALEGEVVWEKGEDCSGLGEGSANYALLIVQCKKGLMERVGVEIDQRDR